MKRLPLFFLSLLPFAAGFFINWILMEFPNSNLPLHFIGLIFLLCWGFLGFAASASKERWESTLCVAHVVAFLVLLANLYQELALGHYWGNLAGAATQLYFLPALSISYALTFWANRMWWCYITGFLLMLLAYCIGLNAGKRCTRRAINCRRLGERPKGL